MNFLLPADVLDIIDKYEKNGYAAHIVGGPVRDFLLGITPHDFDLTTDATPEDTKALFEGERLIETGIRHGTLTLLKSSVPYEITTYRIDGEYLDGRHPEGVTFTRSLAEDLARRDFTVNAMAYAPSSGVVDLFGGQEDLKGHILRAVGNPTKRFEEDALRILRALRFRARLGFAIEQETAKAIFSCAPLMLSLASERVMSEFSGILCGAFAEEVIAEYRAPLSVVLPELADAFTGERLPLNAKCPIPEQAHTPCEEKSIDFDREELFFLRLLALARRASLSRDAYNGMCERLHTSRHIRDDGERILSVLDREMCTEYDILRLLSELGAPLSRIAIELFIHEGHADGEIRNKLARLLREGCAYRIGDLRIKGSDLIPLGFRGQALGEALARLLDAVMRGAVENTPDALIRYIKEN